MRVYVGALVHETNRFSPFPTTAADYQPAATGYQDLVREARRAGCEVVAGMSARAAPSGPTRQADYRQLCDSLVQEVGAAGHLDLVLLHLHGAQVAEDCEDCEGDIVEHLRLRLGDSVTIGVLLDLHASITDTLLQNANLVTAIKEYPHTDFPQTARQLVTLGAACARGQITPVTAFVPVPVYSLWHTPQQPAKSLVDRARSLEASGEALHISLVHGFPWSDVKAAGAAVLVITDRDRPGAIQLARDFAARLWDMRAADLALYRTIASSLDRLDAIEREAGPLVIADGADNPGAGAGSDATWILREALARGLEDTAFALFWDPAALAQIIEAGEGGRVNLRLGGHTGELAGPPVEAEAEVLCINSNAHIDAMPGYPPIAVGTLAAVKIAGVQVVVGSYREQVFGTRVFVEVGIEPTSQRLLVVKSAQHFYLAFAPFAADIVYCDSPGSRTVDFSSLPFRHRRRPIWPLEPVSIRDLAEPRVFD